MPAIESPIDTPTRTGARSGSPTSSRMPPKASATAANPGRLDNGPVCPKAEIRVITRSGLACVEYLRSQPPLFECSGTEVLQQHVAMGDELQHDLASTFGLEVQHDRLLVAVDRAVEHRRGPGVEAPVAEFVAGFRAFDLDDFRSEVGQHAAGCRGGDVVAEFQDAHPVERANVVVIHVHSSVRVSVRKVRSRAGSTGSPPPRRLRLRRCRSSTFLGCSGPAVTAAARRCCS